MSALFDRNGLEERQKQWDAYHAWEKEHPHFPKTDAEAVRRYGELHDLITRLRPPEPKQGITEETWEHIRFLQTIRERLGRLLPKQ